MKSTNNGGKDFLMGELSANVRTLLASVQELRSAHDTSIEKLSTTLESHERDDAQRFRMIERHMWVVVGMGMLLIFLISAASLAVQVFRPTVVSVQYEPQKPSPATTEQQEE